VTLKKIFPVLSVTLLLTGVLSLTLRIPQVKATGTIYINADGSIDPPIASGYIQRNGDQYTFTSNIHGSIIVERDNIVVDGAGYTLQGIGNGTGISLDGRSNVTVRNVKIREFYHGIAIYYSSNINIYRNEIEDNDLLTHRADGIYLVRSSNNMISGNRIENNGDGIEFDAHSSNNTIIRNKIANNYEGIDLWYSSHNTISENNVTSNNWDGIELFFSSNNIISENNIMANYYDGIKISNSSHNTIHGNTMTNNGKGVEFKDSSSNNVFSRNKIIATSHSIYLDIQSNNNTFFGNKIKNSKYGVSLELSSNNMFFYNYFSNITIQATCHQSSNLWDNDYEGNYWSDCKGEDSDGNGIKDTPHVINEENQDNYPLKHPYVDANYDGQVNIIDLTCVAKAYGTNLGDPKYNSHADIDWNDTVNIIDISICASWFEYKWAHP